MKRIKNLGSAFLLLGFIAVLQGCATNSAGFKRASDLEAVLYDMDKPEIEKRLGLPHQSKQLAENRESWIYHSKNSKLDGGSCTITILFEGKQVSIAQVKNDDISFFTFPMGSCKPLIKNF